MKIANKILSAAFGVTLFTGGMMCVHMLAPSAYAQVASAKSIVTKAKAAGTVGESITGYLAIADTKVSPSVKQAVNEINIRRKTVYTQLARSQNESVADVAGVSGEKLVSKAAPGQKVQLSGGVWQTR